MASRCINCGGALIYDIAARKVKCLSCDTLQDPAVYQDAAVAEETTIDNEREDGAEYTTTVFTCPNCGGEITSTESDAVEYCMYCGSFVTLESRMAKIKKPDKIIPFAKTHEDCKKAYRRALRRKFYAPGEFRDEKFIEGFKGMYIPYWNYEYEYGPDVIIKGEQKHRKGDYEFTSHYDIHCKAGGKIDNLAYDASSSFDDQISQRIAPFDKSKLEEFNPAYMFGFYGDVADVEKQLYEEESDKTVYDKVWESATSHSAVKQGKPKEEWPSTFASDFNMRKSSSLAMLPLWLLTWRKGDRIAYSVMNGDTGEMYSEIPISIIRYLVISLLTAVPIFLLLNIGVTLSAKEMLIAANLMAVFALILYVFQLDRIVRRMMHTDDLGYLEANPEAKQESKAKVEDNFISQALEEIWETILEAKVLTVLFVLAVIFFETTYAIIAVAIVGIGVPIYMVYRLYKNARIINDKTVWVDVMGAVAAIIASALMVLIDPSPDMPYYLGSIACMVAVGFAAIRMVKRYNQVITRPLPHFAKGKGAK